MRSIIAASLILFGCSGLLGQTGTPMCEISGTVKDAVGRPIAGGVVKLFGQDQLLYAASGIMASSDKQGQYTLPLVPCGHKFILQAEKDGYQAQSISDLLVTQPKATVDAVLYSNWWVLYPKWWRDQRIIAALLLFLYLFSIFVFRWHNIAVVDQKLLGAELAATRARLAAESDPISAAVLARKANKANEHGGEQHGGEDAPAPAERRARAIKDLLEQSEAPFKGKVELKSWFFWSRGDEISSWMRVREAQRQAVSLWPDNSTERLRVRLETCQQDLRETKKPSALVLADLIKETLILKPPDEERWKQLLSEGLGLLYAINEDSFFLLTIWQSKSTWLSLVACFLMQACVAAQGGGVLMLMGACGGLLSRLMRAWRGTDAPTDYGVSWTTLFLSPVVGAFAGWFGILLVSGFTNLGILNPEIIKTVSFYNDSFATLGLAFVLGFSERLFDGLVNAVDQSVLKDKPGAKTTTTAAVVAPPDGAQTGIKAVKPANPSAGSHAIIFGAALDKANVDGVKLVAPGQADINLPITKQDADSIQFVIPSETPRGKYTLTVMAKNAANVHMSIQVDDAPVPTITEHDAAPVKHGSTVSFSGAALDETSVTVELHDADGKAVEITGLKQLADKIEFTAPDKAGDYTLEVTPKKGGAPIPRNFKVSD
jgi:hypothetical protein